MCCGPSYSFFLCECRSSVHCRPEQVAIQAASLLESKCKLLHHLFSLFTSPGWVPLQSESKVGVATALRDHLSRLDEQLMQVQKEAGKMLQEQEVGRQGGDLCSLLAGRLADRDAGRCVL